MKVYGIYNISSTCSLAGYLQLLTAFSTLLFYYNLLFDVVCYVFPSSTLER